MSGALVQLELTADQGSKPLAEAMRLLPRPEFAPPPGNQRALYFLIRNLPIDHALVCGHIRLELIQPDTGRLTFVLRKRGAAAGMVKVYEYVDLPSLYRMLAATLEREHVTARGCAEQPMPYLEKPNQRVRTPKTKHIFSKNELPKRTIAHHEHEHDTDILD